MVEAEQWLPQFGGFGLSPVLISGSQTPLEIRSLKDARGSADPITSLLSPFLSQLLQRLLDDRKATVEMIQAEGGRIAQSAEPADREKISGQLQSLESRWAALLCRAAGR